MGHCYFAKEKQGQATRQIAACQCICKALDGKVIGSYLETINQSTSNKTIIQSLESVHGKTQRQ